MMGTAFENIIQPLFMMTDQKTIIFIFYKKGLKKRSITSITCLMASNSIKKCHKC